MYLPSIAYGAVRNADMEQNSYLPLTISFIGLYYTKMPSPAPKTTSVSLSEDSQDSHFEYTVLKGFFLQSEDSTDDTKFDFVCLSFPCFSSAFQKF